MRVRNRLTEKCKKGKIQTFVSVLKATIFQLIYTYTYQLVSIKNMLNPMLKQLRVFFINNMSDDYKRNCKNVNIVFIIFD